MAVRFRLRQAGVDDIITGPKVAAHLDDVGDKVKSTVEAQAAAFANSRHFADSIVKGPIRHTPSGPRQTVYSTDWFAHGIEYGSINNAAYAPFRRACAALGLRLTGGGDRP